MSKSHEHALFLEALDAHQVACMRRPLIAAELAKTRAALLAAKDREVAKLREALEDIADTADVYGSSMVAAARTALGRDTR